MKAEKKYVVKVTDSESPCFGKYSKYHAGQTYIKNINEAFVYNAKNALLFDSESWVEVKITIEEKIRKKNNKYDLKP